MAILWTLKFCDVGVLSQSERADCESIKDVSMENFITWRNKKSYTPGFYVQYHLIKRHAVVVGCGGGQWNNLDHLGFFKVHSMHGTLHEHSCLPLPSECGRHGGVRTRDLVRSSATPQPATAGGITKFECSCSDI